MARGVLLYSTPILSPKNVVVLRFIYLEMLSHSMRALAWIYVGPDSGRTNSKL